MSRVIRNRTTIGSAAFLSLILLATSAAAVETEQPPSEESLEQAIGNAPSGIIQVTTGNVRPKDNPIFEIDRVMAVTVDIDILREFLTSRSAPIVLDYGLGRTSAQISNESGQPGDAFYSIDLLVGEAQVGYGYISESKEGLALELHDMRNLGPVLIEPIASSSAYVVVEDVGIASHSLTVLGQSKLNLNADNAVHKQDAETQALRADPETFAEGVVELLETPKGAPDPDRPTVPASSDKQDDDLEPGGFQPAELRTNTGHDVVDISIIYTPAARTELGSTHFSTHARALTQRFNDGFIRSSTNIRVRLVHSRAVAAPASNENDTIAVRDEAAGLNGATALFNDFAFVRTSAASDLTLIITESGSSGTPGVAQGPLPGPGTPSNPANAHAVMYLNITSAAQVGAFHELTHLMGADHRYTNDPGCVPLTSAHGATTESYARGYSWNVNYTTFLLSSAHNSSNCPATSTQGTRLSNPGVTDGGSATGAGANDNARAVDRWGDNIGNFRTGHFCKNDGDAHSTFVVRQYDRLTGKSASTSEVTYYRSNMEKTWRPVDTVNNIVINKSAKMQSVLRMYEGVLGRPADYGGAQGWVNYIHSGQSLTWLAQNFLASGEGQALHGSSSNTQYVTFLYHNALGRNPDSGGLNYWVSQLNSGYSRASLAAYFVSTGESINALGPDVRVTNAWLGIFRSGPSQASINFWRPQFASSTSVWGGVLGLFRSGLFASRVNSSTC